MATTQIGGAITGANLSGKDALPVNNSPSQPASTGNQSNTGISQSNVSTPNIPVPAKVPPGQTPPVNTAQPSPTNANATPYTASQANPTITGIPSNFADIYKQAETNLKNTPVPADPGMAKAAVGQAVTSSTPATQDTTQADAVLGDDKAHQQFLSDYTQSQQSNNQNQDLTSSYKALMDKAGVPALNTELMNMKNVINGTEQDIRDEIAKAGGFATDSQVMALTTARNKSLVQNYNTLLQTRDDAQKNVDTLIGLTEKDRAYAKQQIDDKLNFDKTQIEFADKALTNAKDSLSNMQKTEGWDGIYKAALATGDKQAIARINSTMGNGFDLASMAKADAVTRSQKALTDKAATVNAQNTIDKANEDAGIPIPSKANQPGFNDKGVKYNTDSAQKEVVAQWKSQGAFDKNNSVPPANYNQAKAWWVANTLPAAEFDSIMGQYKSDQTNKQYN